VNMIYTWDLRANNNNNNNNTIIINELIIQIGTRNY
jgi:hypothetical protein